VIRAPFAIRKQLALESHILKTSPMKVATPHYLLFSESCRQDDEGRWRFVLQTVDGSEQLEATDAEPDVNGDRLELLAVVRGLEALEQPSRVTLVTPSKYVNRGLALGLEDWRENNWEWEHYGEMVPVKNRDLWQRIDRALQFHELECRVWRFDPPHTAAAAAVTPHLEAATAARSSGRANWLWSAVADWLRFQLEVAKAWLSLSRNPRFAPHSVSLSQVKLGGSV
jgi:ribonuclease HI